MGDDGDDTLFGGDGDDFLYGGIGADSVRGDGGNDSVQGFLGDDTLVGGLGNDSLDGGDDNDSLLGQSGDDFLMGGNGDDTLDGGIGDDTLWAGEGDDVIMGGTGADTMAGEGGDDTFVLEDGFGADVIQGGETGETIGDTLDASGVTTDITLDLSAGDPFNPEDGTISSDALAPAPAGMHYVRVFEPNTTITGFGVYPSGPIDFTDGTFHYILVADEDTALHDSQGISGGGGVMDTTQTFAEDLDGLSTTGLGIGAAGISTYVDANGNSFQVGWIASYYGGVANGVPYQQYLIVSDAAGATPVGVSTATGAQNAIATIPYASMTGPGDAVASFSEIETFVLGSGDDSVVGSSGNDNVFTGAGADTVAAGAGDDTYDLGLGDGAADVVVLADGAGNDTVQSFDLTDSGDGTTIDQLDVSGLTSDGGTTPVHAGDVVVTDTNGDGTGDAILTFPGGESITLVGVLASQVDSVDELVAIGIPDGRNFIVEGTSGDDLIDATYVGDPQGDLIDSGDHSDASNFDNVQAGAGDDTVMAGLAGDSVDGGDGNDVLYGGGVSYTSSAPFSADFNNLTTDPGIGSSGGSFGTGASGGAAGFQFTGDSYIIADPDQGGADVGDVDSINVTFNFDVGTTQAGPTGGISFSFGDPTSIYADPGLGLTDGVTVQLSSATNEVVFSWNGVEIGREPYGGSVIGLSATSGSVSVDETGLVTFTSNISPNSPFTAQIPGDEWALADTSDYTFVAGMDAGALNNNNWVNNIAFNGTAEQTNTGDDTLLGGQGDDSLFGQDGADSLVGGTGADTLFGGDGLDLLSGGDGNDVLYGGTGGAADQLYGDAGNDLIYAGDGDNTLVRGGDGDDTIFGEEGNDLLQGEVGNDVIYGGVGNDGLAGGDGNDTLYGGDGDDLIGGEGGDDSVVLEDGFGNDTIIGGEIDEIGGDTLDLSAITTDTTVDLTSNDPEAGSVSDGVSTAAFTEIENIVLGGGRDTVVLADGSGSDTVQAFDLTDSGDGTTNDQLDVSGLTSDGGTTPVTTADVVVTDTNGDGTGDAILTFPGGESITLVGVLASQVDSIDELVAIGIPDGRDFIVEGTSGADQIDGTYLGDPNGDLVDALDNATGTNDDVIYGYGGADTINAGSGSDLVYGGDDNDVLRAMSGNDTLYGDAGADDLQSGTGNDILDGGAGSDLIHVNANSGNDTVVGGETGETGSGDVLDFDTAATPSVVTFTGDEAGTATAGTSTITFSEIETIWTDAGNDTIDGSVANSAITVWAGDGDDSIIGGAGNDTIYGFGDNDTIAAGAGDDSVYGGLGNDTVAGGAGNDTIYGDDGDDSLTGGLGNDVLDGGIGADTINGEEGDDTILGGDGNDSLIGFSGSDSVDGGAGDDYINTRTAPGTGLPDVGYPGSFPADADPNNDRDTVDGGSGNDTILTGDDDDLIDGGIGNDVIDAGFDDDTVYGGDGDDNITANEGNDYVEGGAGNDIIYGDGTDTLTGPLNIDDATDLAPNNGLDTLFGGDGNDTIYGMDDNDLLYGGLGNDVLDGGLDNDTIYGDAGADTITVGSGDFAYGGDGDDTFVITPDLLDGTVLTVDGGEGDETVGDTLNITGPATIAYTGGDPSSESGTVTWLDGTVLNFSNIENVTYIPCFTKDSLIKTRKGEVRAADLSVGDLVLTRDHGMQPIRWIGARILGGDELAQAKSVRPVLIRKGALGPNQPERDLLVSPQHRMLVSGPKVELWFGEQEVLVAAIHLTILDGIEQIAVDEVTYVHFMFDEHEIVCGDGAWSESFQPGDLSLQGIAQEQRAELMMLFPELECHGGSLPYGAARPSLKSYEVPLLLA